MKRKSIVLIISAVLVVVVSLSVTIGYFIAKHSFENDSSLTETSSFKDKTEQTSDTENESDISTTDRNLSGNAADISVLILGSWKDNANFSGYEFSEGGLMKVTYFNTSLLNLEDVVSGTFDGAYSVEGDRLHISYTVYSKSVTRDYTVRFENNAMILTDSSGEESTYIRDGSQSVADFTDSDVLGAWQSSLAGYEFRDNGIVTITYINLSSLGVNIDFKGSTDGIYTIDGNVLTLKYSIYSATITKKYTYSVKDNVLTLVDESGEESTYTRKNGD